MCRGSERITSLRGCVAQATKCSRCSSRGLRSISSVPQARSPHTYRSLRIWSSTPSLTSQWIGSSTKGSSNYKRTFWTMAESQSWWRGSGEGNSPAQEGPRTFESRPLEIPEESQVEAEQLRTRRVHILGLGSIGTLVAHSLRCLPNPPPITLMMHRPEAYEKFKGKARIVRLVNMKTDVNDEQSGYDVDVLEIDAQTDLPRWTFVPDVPDAETRTPSNPLQEGEMNPDTKEVYIYTVVVSVKGPATVNALASIKHRLNKHSTVCLMQNGMGQIDELNRVVFTDPETRPTYMLGIVSHGAYLDDVFAVNHAGFGTTALGIYRDTDKFPLPPKSSSASLDSLSEDERRRFYPSDQDLFSELSSRYLLRTLTRSPVLACAAFPYLDLFQLQLEKLAMNAVLNPLTALLNVPNGSMLANDSLARAQRLLLAEISLVIRSLPELDAIPGVKIRFSPSRLETLFQSISKTTARNSSSMREDVRNLKQTEIDYINGYVVRRGEEMGIKCVLNYLVMQLIHGKSFDARRSGSVRPYGVSSIESTMSKDQLDQQESVMLEDTGTQLKGQPY